MGRVNWKHPCHSFWYEYHFYPSRAKNSLRCKWGLLDISVSLQIFHVIAGLYFTHENSFYAVLIVFKAILTFEIKRGHFYKKILAINATVSDKLTMFDNQISSILDHSKKKRYLIGKYIAYIGNEINSLRL